MSGKIILAREENSVRFHDKVLLITDGQTVKVSRSSSDDKPDTCNAVFDCRVLSKHQASITFRDGKFYLKDVGSSNGTFVNNFRLSKSGVESDDSQIYTEDVLRFGAQIESDGQKSKCVICKIKVYRPDGTEAPVRSISDRFYRPKSDFLSKENVKQVKFSDQSPSNGFKVESSVIKLEKIITEKFEKDQQSLKESITALEKKLRRKQNENQNLMDNIEKLTKVELDRVSEIYDLKEVLAERDKECVKLSDELAVKTKEQIDNIKVKDLESELEELRKALKITTEELWLHKEKLKIETENKRKKESKDELENNILPKENGEMGKNQSSANIIEDQREEIELLNQTISRGDEIIKSKDKEILNLKKIIMKDQEKMFITEGEYSSLRCMMTEENETIHQVQQEMSRLLQIISDDQEAMVLKDKTIADLGLEKDSLNIKISNLTSSLVEKDIRLEEAEASLKKQTDLLEMIETYKGKVKEAMDVIAVKSQQLESYSSGDAATERKEMESLREELKTRERTIQQEQLRNEELENSQSQLQLKLISLQSAVAEKDDEIKRLSQEVENEREVAHHVQFTQERELMMKEKEMITLSRILTEERKVLLEKEEEIKQLNSNKVLMRKMSNKSYEAPTRPPRTRSLFITTNMQVEPGVEKVEESADDGSDTVTFHDAINQDDTAYIESDEEDVLIDDLELDEDTDDRLPRRSDINFDQFSLG